MFAAFKQSINEPQNLVSQYGMHAALFNAGLVAGQEHLEFARVHTDKAIANGENIARDYNIEFLVRLSGRSQIEKALGIGVRKGVYLGIMADENVVAALEDKVGTRDDILLELTAEKEKDIQMFFGVSGSGKELQRKIFEKIALVSIV
jgi:tRNA threonylcarbamoyladenosine modification (KEOPS) complex Cgi121 subunit